MAVKKNTSKSVKEAHYVPVKKTAGKPKADKAVKINTKTQTGEEIRTKPELTPEEKEKRARKAQRRSNLLAQILPYVLGVLTLFLLVCLIWPNVMGIAGQGIHDFIFGLFGRAAYIIPAFILGHAVMWRKDTEEERLGGKFITSVGSEVLLAMLHHAYTTSKEAWTVYETSFSLKDHWTNGVAENGGGVFGGFFGASLITVFGRVGMLILTIAGLILLLMLFFGLTPRTIWVWILYQIKKSKEKRAEEKAYLAEKQGNEKVYEYRKDKASGSAEPAIPVSSVRETGRQMRIEEEPMPKNRRADFEADIPVDDPVKKEPLIIPSLEKKFEEEKLREEAKRRQRESEAQNSINRDKETLLKEMNRQAQTEASSDRAEDGEKALDDAVYEQYLAKTRRPGEISGAVPKDMIVAERGESLQNHPNLEKLDPDEIEKDGAASPVTPNLSDIFVDPEDKLLIDRLADQYLKGNQNEISTENEKSPVKEPEPSEEPAPAKPKRQDNYKFPPLDLLYEDLAQKDENIKEELYENASKLVETLKSFNVKTKIVDVSRGPTITRYELLPEAGTRVRAIANLVDDISLNLATGGVRIEAPIPGKAAVGIEVPNRNPAVVHLRTLLDDKRFTEHKSAVCAVLGEDVAGASIYCDIEKMPHLLIAGATGMGKSVCINSLIVSLLYKSSPDDVRLILVDPKKVELSIYNGIPHLLTPVVSDPRKASGALTWAVNEMERRFGLIEQVGVRDIKHFNEATKDDPDYEYLPKIVIIIDELADLMMTAPKEVEANICRLAQKARAAGMHLVIGTQRPSVDVITGLIKANIPSRIAFTVASQIDSRTIIDRSGAESLVGRGDMLYNPVGAQKPLRVQGAFVSESDVEKVVDYIKRTSGVAEYDQQVSRQIDEEAARSAEGSSHKGGGSEEAGGEEASGDPMLKKAVELAVESGKISTSLIQRRLSLGYGRAAKLIDQMEELGYVSAPDGQKPREVLITKEQFMEMVVRGEDL